MNARVVLATLLIPAVAAANQIEFSDPKGDDDGHGKYEYPTDPVYARGSFDMTGVELEDDGDTVTVKVSFAAKIEDPWNSKEWKGNGFSLQMVFLFIDKDGKAGSGHAQSLPGLNVTFADDARWEKVLLISPQGNARLKNEIRGKARKLKKDIVLPSKVKARGRTIVAKFSKADIGGLDASWGFQALVQSNEGYPRAKDLLTRPVNEFKGKHRFGGGSDFDCDPHVIDMLAGAGKGGADEKAAQHKALSTYQCTDDPDGGKQAVIGMVRAK